MNNPNKHTILVVNDSADELELTEFILRQSDYNVLTAAGGRDGFDTLQKNTVDLVISDVIMPDGDGIELCRRIRSGGGGDRKFQTVPILLISGLRKDTASVVEGLESGADDYMETPVDSVHLIAKVARLTERKRMEDVLRMSESYFRSLIENVSDIISILSAQGVIYYESPSIAQILGHAPESLYGKNVFDFIHPEDKSRVSTALKDIFDKGGISLPVEYRFRCADGSWCVLESIGKIIDDPKRGLVSVINSRDITGRKNAESSIHFQAHLLNTVEQSIIATDLNGKVTYWNQFAEKLYGWSGAEALNRNIMDLTPAETSTEQAKEIMSQLGKGESWNGEFAVKTKEGRTFPAMITNSPIFNEKGGLIGVVGISKDITGRKQTETALIEANQRAIRQYNDLLQRLAKLGETVGVARNLDAVFSAVLDFTRVSAPCSALVISLCEEKSQIRKVVYCWYEDSEEVGIKSDCAPLNEDFVDRAIKIGEVVINNRHANTTEKKSAAANFDFRENTGKPQSSIIAPMKIKGVGIGVIEVQSSEPEAYGEEHATAMSMAANFIAVAIENVRLLELERQREEQLRQSQKLESVGRLAGGIAHDFNNMLTAINGYSNLTLRRLGDDDPLRRNVEEIRKAGERSAALTHQLLAFSRQQILKPKLLDINQTVNDINLMLRRLIGEDIQLISALHSDIGQVEVDPGQLSQVIMNLAVNARDAMPRGGTLIIETSNQYLDEEFAAEHAPTTVGHYVMLAVTDTGTGIAPETREHIFEPFFTTKEVGKGTGLGLATVYGIVKQSGGYIWVYSEPEQGSTFKIYLPRVDQESTWPKKPEEQQAREELVTGTQTILLVEDEQIVRDLSREILEECGYTVLQAGDGVEALDVFNNAGFTIDLLMTDVVMPRMGGRELAEKLAETHPQMKVLYTSGYTDDSVVRHGVIAVGTNFIQKPFSPHTLAAKIRDIFDAEK